MTNNPGKVFFCIFILGMALSVSAADKDDLRKAKIEKYRIDLQSGSTGIRNRAAHILAALGDPSGLDVLTEILLRDENFKARLHAARSIGKLDNPNATFPLLTAYMTDSAGVVRSECFKVLEKLGKKAVPFYSRAIRKRITPVREGAVEVIQIFIRKGVLDRKNERLIREAQGEAVKESLANPDRAARFLSGMRLGRSLNPLAVPVLVEIISDPAQPFPTRVEASRLLGKIADPTAVRPLLEAAVHDSVDLFRMHAVRAILKMGKKATGQLGRIAGESDADMRRLAVQLFFRIDPAKGRAPLVRAYKKDLLEPDETIRINATFGLAKLDEKACIPELIRFVEEEKVDWKKRIRALNHMADINDARAVPLLIHVAGAGLTQRDREEAFKALLRMKLKAVSKKMVRALDDPDYRVRTAAMKILEKRKVLSRANKTRKFLSDVHDADRGVRTRGALGLAAVGNNKGVPVLLELIADDRQHMSKRIAYINAIKPLADPKVVEPLARLIARKGSGGIVSAAVKAVVRVGNKAKTTLKKLAGNNDDRLRDAAIDLLEKISQANG